MEDKEKQPSFFADFWPAFKQNRGAMVGLVVIIFFILFSLLAPLMAPYGPSELFTESLRLPPFWGRDGSGSMGGEKFFFLGTDDVGRDLLSRLLYGSRISMGIGFGVVLFSLTAGTFFGLLAGYYGGIVDKGIMRIMDILMALPSILLAIVVVSILGPGIENTILAVSIVAIPGFTRIVRASVKAENKKQYVQAARIFGASNRYIMLREILPNCMAPLIVQGSLGFSDGILNAAALGFLGLGVQAPIPEWGVMLSDARPFIESSPWMVTLPGLCILLVVLGFNLLGDGLRDALDPRLKK